MGEIAGVNTASLGGYIHSTKTRARWSEGFPMNSTAPCSTWRGMGSVRLYFAKDSPCDDNTQPYHTGSVAARVNKDRAFRRTSGRRCQVCYWCIIEDCADVVLLHGCLESVSYVEEDGTTGLVAEVFDDLDKVVADVVLLHGCPQSYMPNPVEGLLEVYEDMAEVLLVLEIFLTENA